MTRLASLLLFSLSASASASAAACAAPAADASDATSSAFTASRWEKVYQCDDGTVLDVNANERQQIQLVVRGQAAVDYLTTALPDPYAGNVTPNAKGELIFQGWVYNHGKPGANPPPQGIFQPSDFTVTEGTAGNMPARIVHERSDQIRVFLDIPHEERPIDATPVPTDWIFRNCH